MRNTNYGLYGLAIAGGVGVALWAGLPAYLLLLLACPLMMVFMMRGMHGGQDRHDAHPGSSGHENARPADAARQAGDTTTGPSLPDGSHERIDRP